LLLQACKRLPRQPQILGRLCGIRRLLPRVPRLRCRPLHLLLRLPHPIERLRRCPALRALGIAAVGAACTAVAALRALAAIAALSVLAAGAVVAALAALRALAASALPLLAVLCQLVQLLLQLLGLPAQHLLLPALLGGLLLVLRLGQILLAARQFVQLFQGVVNGLRFLLLARRRLLRLVLVLLGVEFEIEQAGQVACGAAATTTSSSSARAKRDLDLPERRLGLQQRTQRLLLVRHRRRPFLRAQALRRRLHRRGSGDHVLLEVAECLVLIRQLARLHASRYLHRLVIQRRLRLRKQLGG